MSVTSIGDMCPSKLAVLPSDNAHLVRSLQFSRLLSGVFPMERRPPLTQIARTGTPCFAPPFQVTYVTANEHCLERSFARRTSRAPAVDSGGPRSGAEMEV